MSICPPTQPKWAGADSESLDMSCHSAAGLETPPLRIPYSPLAISARLDALSVSMSGSLSSSMDGIEMDARFWAGRNIWVDREIVSGELFVSGALVFSDFAKLPLVSVAVDATGPVRWPVEPAAVQLAPGSGSCHHILHDRACQWPHSQPQSQRALNEGPAPPSFHACRCLSPGAIGLGLLGRC